MCEVRRQGESGQVADEQRGIEEGDGRDAEISTWGTFEGGLATKGKSEWRRTREGEGERKRERLRMSKP